MSADMETLIKLSQHYGHDSEFVIAGGGNTSMKTADRLWVKASGTTLADITADGFVELDRRQLQALLDGELSDNRAQREEQFKNAILAARIAPEKNQRPSVEAVLHHLMPRKFVVHSHSTVANMFTCCQQGEKLAREVLGDAMLWMADVDPGYILAKTLADALKDYEKKTGRNCPRAVLMQNHGLVICGDSEEQIHADTEWVISALRRRVERTPTSPLLAIDAARSRRLINIIGPALRGLLANGATLKIASFDDSHAVMSMVAADAGRKLAAGGPLTPDQIVYCKAFALWFKPESEEPAAIVESLRAAIENHVKNHRLPPQVVLIEGVGLFGVGDDFAAANTARLVYADAAKIMIGAQRLGGVRYLRPEQREFFENWEVEVYRRGVAAAQKNAGRAAGKVAAVTGAAQGFGLEIAQDLVLQGGLVALLDLNAEGVKKAAEGLGDKAVGLSVNVTDGGSVGEAIHQIVRRFGGFDLFISNAGVLKAGSVKTLAEKDFDFVTNVNYKGYFVCVQQAAPILAIQRLARSDYFSDIIQINSKSGLQGSNRNGAYAGSKFGGVGLTQSFAMELIEDGIKVNAICPGNFFDGPLWSHPQTGLFVQYLRSGKVPGAKNIEDVKKAYEAKVPMGRGCTTADVMKAVYYLMEQVYETGQALPVTGGQVMLK